MKLPYCIFAIVVLLAIGCSKEPDDIVPEYVGKWTVRELYTEYYDTTGLLRKTEMTDVGVIDFRQGSPYGETWHEMRFDTAIRNQVAPFNYLALKGVLDQYPDNEFGCFWDVDMDDRRFYLEGLVGANSAIVVVNMDRGSNQMTWTYYEDDGPVYQSLTKKQVIVLRK